MPLTPPTTHNDLRSFGSRSLPPLLLHVFPSFAIGGSQVRFVTLANSPAHNFRHLIFAIDGRYDCFRYCKPDAVVEVTHLPFPRTGTVANVVAACRALRCLDPT